MSKKITILFMLFWAISAQYLFGQVDEGMKEMSLGYRMGFTIELPATDDKVATSVWKNYVKDFLGAKTKWNRKTKEYVSESVNNSVLDDGHGVAFYAKIKQNGDDVLLTLWVDQGSAFASSENGGSKEVEKILLKYALEVAQENLRLELENEEAVLKKLESQKKKLISAEKKYQKEIERAQDRLKDNEKEQEKTMKEIEAQLQKIKKVKNKLSDL